MALLIRSVSTQDGGATENTSRGRWAPGSGLLGRQKVLKSCWKSLAHDHHQEGEEIRANETRGFPSWTLSIFVREIKMSMQSAVRGGNVHRTFCRVCAEGGGAGVGPAPVHPWWGGAAVGRTRPSW